MRLFNSIKKYICFNNHPVYVLLYIFLTFFVTSLFFFAHTIDASIPQQEIIIDYRTKNVTAVLKGVEVKKVLEEIAKKTGIDFVGLDEVSGVLEDLELKDVPLENAIKSIGKDNILIFRKEGPEDGEKAIKKVIILVQKEEKPPTPPPPPPPKKIEPLPPPKIEKPEPPKPKPAMPLPPPPPVEKPKPTPKPIPVVTPKTPEECLALGNKYYNAKRWDLAVKNFRCYLKKNPDDQDVEDKIDNANKFAQEAIDIYRAARKEEAECNLKSALELYEKSYKLYPLLYDTWERIQALRKKCKCC